MCMCVCVCVDIPVFVFVFYWSSRIKQMQQSVPVYGNSILGWEISSCRWMLPGYHFKVEDLPQEWQAIATQLYSTWNCGKHTCLATASLSKHSFTWLHVLLFTGQHWWVPVIAMPTRWCLQWEHHPWQIHMQLCGWVDGSELWKSSTVLQWQHLWQ